MVAPTLGQYRNNWFIIAGALTVVPVIYAVLARVIAPGTPPSPIVATLRPVLMAVAGLQLLLGTFVFLRARAPAFIGAADASVADGQLAPPTQFMMRTIVGMAFFEAISIYGFVLMFLGNDPAECMVWSAVSLIGMLGV